MPIVTKRDNVIWETARKKILHLSVFKFFMSILNFVLSWVEHGKSFITSRPDPVLGSSLGFWRKIWSSSIYLAGSKDSCKIVIIFIPINLNICFGCSKEPSYWDGSFEYPQHMFWLRNKEKSFQYALLSGGLLTGQMLRLIWVFPGC